ncbi:MAG: ATP-binding protein, partial [Thermoanaerobaculia bacterium]|nr:ATP-binding protein [Thermoanaerobaculia bacterium]
GAIGSAHVRRQITIEVDHADEDHAVEIDREQIDQVFTNLVINARDASPEGSKISIEARRDPAGSTYSFGVVENPDRFVHFAVTDEGSGIPENMLKSIFEPMITTKRHGTGLGLGVTHLIVSSHGGHVFAESTEGEGTTMHVFLPEASRRQESESSGEESAGASE